MLYQKKLPFENTRNWEKFGRRNAIWHGYIGRCDISMAVRPHAQADHLYNYSVQIRVNQGPVINIYGSTYGYPDKPTAYSVAIEDTLRFMKVLRPEMLL